MFYWKDKSTWKTSISILNRRISFFYALEADRGLCE